MRTGRIVGAVMLALFCLGAQARTSESKSPQKVTVFGKRTRAMAIGAESTGWSIEFDSETKVAGTVMHSIEISYPKGDKLEKLANQRVKATGKLSHRQGVETGDRTILEVTSIKAKSQ